MNNFGSYPLFDPPGSGQFEIFLTYVITADKREVLRLYFEHICVLLLFMVFLGKLSYAVKVNNFGSYPIIAPWIRPISYVIKVDKREELTLNFEDIDVLLLFLVLPGKLPLYGKSE